MSYRTWLLFFFGIVHGTVVDENSTAVHPEAWNNNANIFFVDQPIGVGFSHAEHGQTVVSPGTLL
jgi:carboxypeptidase C (cathepsin A)